MPLHEHVDDFVRETFVLPAADPETRIRIDFIFSTTPYERQAVDRATRVELEGEEWAQRFSEVPGRKELVERMRALRRDLAGES